MLLTLATIPEEPGSEAQELEKLSIRELQLKLSAEMARVAEVRLQESDGLGNSLVLHKCVVRGCISEPTGFGRGRQSSFIGSLGDGGKLDGCGVAVPSGDWMLLGGKAMNKSLALAEHWNVALGDWEDDMPADASAMDVGGYLEYRFESEVVALPMSGAQILAQRGEEGAPRSAAGEGDEEGDMHQGYGMQIPRMEELTAWGHSAQEFDRHGSGLEINGELRTRASSGADIATLSKSETRAGNATVDEWEAGRVLEGDSASAVELRGTIEGNFMVEEVEQAVGGPCKTFLGIPRRTLVPSSKTELWYSSTIGPGQEGCPNKTVDVVVNGGSHTAASLAVEEEDVGTSPDGPLSAVPVALRSLEGKQWQNDGQQVHEEGSLSGLSGVIYPWEPDVLFSIANLDDDPFVEQVVDCNGGAMVADKGYFPTEVMACAVASSQELKTADPTLAGVGPLCMPHEPVLESDSCIQSFFQAPKLNHGATGNSLVRGSAGESEDNSVQNYCLEDPESTSGSSGPSQVSLSRNPRKEGSLQVSEVFCSEAADESFGINSGLLNGDYQSPPTAGEKRTSPGEDIPAVHSAAVVDESSGLLDASADIGVRQVAERRAAGAIHAAKDNAGTSKGSHVQSRTAAQAACVTELVGDSSASHLAGFQHNPQMDAIVRDSSLLDLNSNGLGSTIHPGVENPGEYTTLLENWERKLRPSVTGDSASQVSERSLRGCDDEAIAQRKLLPHPRSPLLDLQDRVCFGAIGYTASDLRSDTTEELGEVTGLVDELLTDSLETRCRAAEKIRTLTKYNAKARTRMGQHDATDRSGKHRLIPALVSFLHSAVHHDYVDQSPATSRKTQEMAACAILNLGINNDRNKAAIVAAGAVPELVELLKGNVGVRTKEAAIAALLTLSCLQENHAHMGTTRGTISQLVHVLRRGTKQSCKDALTALTNLTASMRNRQRMVRAGAVRALTRLLATGDYGESPLPDAPLIQDAIIGEKCVALLYNLSFSKEGRETILNTNGTLAVLCEIVDSELSTETEKEHAASTLWNLCCNSTCHSQLVKEEGVTPALIALSVQGSVRAQEKARLLLAHLSTICDEQYEQGSVRCRSSGSFPRQLEPSSLDDGYVASESEKSVESASESLCSTPASQPLRISMQWSGPEVPYSAPLERTSNLHRDCKGNSGRRRSMFGNLLRHINPLARHNRSASSLVPFGRKS